MMANWLPDAARAVGTSAVDAGMGTAVRTAPMPYERVAIMATISAAAE